MLHQVWICLYCMAVDETSSVATTTQKKEHAEGGGQRAQIALGAILRTHVNKYANKCRLFS